MVLTIRELGPGLCFGAEVLGRRVTDLTDSEFIRVAAAFHERGVLVSSVDLSHIWRWMRRCEAEEELLSTFLLCSRYRVYVILRNGRSKLRGVQITAAHSGSRHCIPSFCIRP